MDKFIEIEMKQLEWTKIEGNQSFSPIMSKIMKNPQFALFSMFLYLNTSPHRLYSEWEYYMRRSDLVNSEHYKKVYVFFYNLPVMKGVNIYYH